MPPEIIALLNGIVKLVTILLEGVPPEIRLANAKVWFFLWWPLGKFILSRSGLDAAQLAEVETSIKGAK